MGVAIRRAAHQLIDVPRVLDDPLAVPLLGAEARSRLEQTLADGLSRCGFNRLLPAFFSWLGVTMYLTDEAFMSAVTLIAATAPGGGLVFDYAISRSLLGPVGQLAFDAMANRVGAAGEPF